MQMLIWKQNSQREPEDREFLYRAEVQLHNDENLISFCWFELYYNAINQISFG